MAFGSSLPQTPGFPRLHPDNHEVTSPSSRRYNCIAWAAGDTGHWWWPDVDPDDAIFWPPGVPTEETLYAFVAAFATLGYFPCSGEEPEPGFERVALFAGRLGDASPTVLIRDQAKRWGSCSRKGELRFNWRVILAPLPLVDYVVAHEVCHLKLKNHSAAFWRLLRRLLPDYERRRERLRVLGVQFRF